MSSGRAKKESYYDTQKRLAMEEVKKPSPLQLKLDAKAQKWLDWESSTAPKNILDAPGMSDYLDIHGASKRREEADRVAMGALNLADTNSAYSDQIKQQNKMVAHDIAAENLHNALGGLKNEAYGLANQSIGYDMNRKNTYAGLALQDEQNYYNRPKKEPWWKTVLGLGMQGAQTAAQIGRAAAF